eukprot:1467070-Amphidinium_carterae.1
MTMQMASRAVESVSLGIRKVLLNSLFVLTELHIHPQHKHAARGAYCCRMPFGTCVEHNKPYGHESSESNVVAPAGKSHRTLLLSTKPLPGTCSFSLEARFNMLLPPYVRTMQ